MEVELAERFFSNDPNVMVTVNEEEKEVKLSRPRLLKKTLNKIHKGIKEIAHDGLYSFKYKIYGKNIINQSMTSIK